MNQAVQIQKTDNVGVALKELSAGESALGITLLEAIPKGHKFALSPIAAGESVIKYACSIGKAKAPIKAGEHIHTHNLATALTEGENLTFLGEYPYAPTESGLTFSGYRRADGRVGVRNAVFVLPTVFCAAKSAEHIAEAARKAFDFPDGIHVFPHPYGCSQLTEDAENTTRFLASLAANPNAGGVLFVSLGCENNNFGVLKPYLSREVLDRSKFLVLQESDDEIKDGLKLIEELLSVMKNDKRTDEPLEKLTIGMKCGGSDGFSGLTANPLCGRISDRLTSVGGRVLLTEVPEMFGAEAGLLGRCVSREVFDKAVGMIGSFKQYFLSHGQKIYENPSPGNKAGGITTLEEKSLGCVTKGGLSAVTDVLPLYGRCEKAGLSLLWGPGNDPVSVSNLAAAGAVLILFTTGRGTPFGAPVPTLKLSTNTALFEKKPGWIDFDAGRLLGGLDFDTAAEELLHLILETADGKQTKNEQNGFDEIAVFKDGVTL